MADRRAPGTAASPLVIWRGRAENRRRKEIKLSRPRPPLRLCVLAALSVGLLVMAGAAQATTTGTVVPWGCGGENNSGQCSVPSGLAGAVTAIAAGSSHSMALKNDGTVVAWGCQGEFADWGQCTVPSGLSGVNAIAAGNEHSLALKSDGTVVAWGCGGVANFGQCTAPSGLAGATAIAAGQYYNLALKSDGTVVAWGCGGFLEFGQCNVPSGLADVAAIAAGYSQSLALKDDGTVVAWGCGAGTNHGQCAVPNGLAGVTAIAAGSLHSLALKSDGTVVAWGCGAGGDFGQCSVPNGLTGVTAIAAGDSHSLALKSDGTVVAWGCGFIDAGQCGVPSGLTGVTAIATGGSHSLALAELANQTITFGALASKTYGDPDFAISATASSGLTVSFAASGNCTVSGATVHLTGAGSCTVKASQTGNLNYNPAPDVSHSFAIAKASQSISFGQLANKTYGAPNFSVSARASSGLTVSFAASGRCTVSGASVHLTGVGSCRITSSQAGDANYNPAPDVSRTFSIIPAPCRVPKVVGKRLASAKRTIALRHCRTGKVGYAYSPKRKRGIVISQSRRPGRVLPARSKINLIVSRGRRR
jgi:alpha-tubulin suppressor-like RCC1 family protein